MRLVGLAQGINSGIAALEGVFLGLITMSLNSANDKMWATTITSRSELKVTFGRELQFYLQNTVIISYDDYYDKKQSRTQVN